MGIAGVFLFIMGPIMMVAAITTGQPPEPERIPAPHRTNTLPPGWLPELQAAANHYSHDTAHKVEVTYHHQVEEDLLAQVMDNIGPALGWHFRRIDRRTVVTLPAGDLPLLDRLAEDPATFVAENAHAPPRTERPGRYLNAEIDWKFVPGQHTAPRIIAAIAGFILTVAGALMIATALYQTDRKDRTTT